MTETLEAVRRIALEHGNDLALVVKHSGGKDSIRMLGFVRKKFPDVPTYAVMADTGFEHVSPISAVDFARARCAEFGLGLPLVRNASVPIWRWWNTAECFPHRSIGNARPI
jgi:3'-phosphoadenosine 5'-phosphosulfate sulfotransferase (PAPS reductase)/FAD synthetase